jgi:hypothetical protein
MILKLMCIWLVFIQYYLVLPLERGGSSAVGRGRAGRPAGPTTANNTATTTLKW